MFAHAQTMAPWISKAAQVQSTEVLSQRGWRQMSLVMVHLWITGEEDERLWKL